MVRTHVVRRRHQTLDQVVWLPTTFGSYGWSVCSNESNDYLMLWWCVFGLVALVVYIFLLIL